MFEITRSGNGIFSIGNMNPLSNKVGSIVAISDINIAVCCDSDLMEISKPRNNEVMMNTRLTAYNKKILPCTGNLRK